MHFQIEMIFDEINFIVGKSLRSPGNRLLCSKVAVQRQFDGYFQSDIKSNDENIKNGN